MATNTMTVELEGRTYTIDLTPVSVDQFTTTYTIRGQRGAVGHIAVTPHVGNLKVFGIERLARRGRKLADALDGIVPGVKGRATLLAEEQAATRKKVSARQLASFRHQLARNKTLAERARRARITATVEPVRPGPQDGHLTLIECQ